MPDDIYFDEPVVQQEAIPTKSEEQEAVPENEAASFRRRVIAVQRRLKAPKNQYNAFSKFFFRSCEDILEGVKPLLKDNNLMLTLNDEIVVIGERFYVKATATILDALSDNSISTTAYAREPLDRKGSDQSQVTGSCSSYARKYALNGLLLTDDNKDADAEEPKQGQKPKGQQPQQQGQQQNQQPVLAHCTNCGTRYQFANVADYMSYVANNPCCAAPNWVVE